MAGGTNYRPFSPEIWSPYVKLYFKERLTYANFGMNFSDELKGGGDVINLPSLTKGPAVGSFTTTTGAITDFIVVETRSQLTINNWKYSSKKFSDFEWGRIANKYNLQNLYLREDIAYRLAEDLDSTLMTSAPWSARICPRTVPAHIQPKSTTRNPAKVSFFMAKLPQPFLMLPALLWNIPDDDKISPRYVLPSGVPVVR